MKYWIGILLNGLLVMSMTAQVNNRVIVKSLDMDLVDEVLISNGVEVEYQQWDKDFGRVLLSISTEGLNDSEFKALLRNNRYKMEQSDVDGVMHISFPNIDVDLLDGIKENVKVKCFVPAHVQTAFDYENTPISSELLF